MLAWLATSLYAAAAALRALVDDTVTIEVEQLDSVSILFASDSKKLARASAHPAIAFRDSLAPLWYEFNLR